MTFPIPKTKGDDKVVPQTRVKLVCVQLGHLEFMVDTMVDGVNEPRNITGGASACSSVPIFIV